MSVNSKKNDYIEILISGDEDIRFLNMCKNKELNLWHIRYTDRGITARITRKDFFRIKDIKRKCFVDIRVIKKHDIRYLLFKYRKHYSFLLGIFISFVFIKTVSLYVWNIEFSGNYYYTNEMLMHFLDDNGIVLGNRIKRLNCEEIEGLLRNNFSDITWVNAQIKGTRLIVHIKEAKRDELLACEDVGYSDIISGYDGTVGYMVTRRGEPVVMVNDEVKAGDVLVSCTVPINDDFGEPLTEIYVEPDADIFLKTTLEYENSLNCAYTSKEYTGKRIKIHFYDIFNYEVKVKLSLKHFKKYDIITENVDYKLSDDYFLPISGRKTYYMEYDEVESVYSEEEADNLLKRDFLRYMDKLKENDVQIVDYHVNIEKANDKYNCKGTIDVIVPADLKIQ